jgi:hypothetical protein
MNHSAIEPVVATAYASEHDAIVGAVQHYIDGSRAGRSELMRPAFHADAMIIGYFGGSLIVSPIQKLFDLIDGNGPAPDIEARIAGIQLHETIASVHLEVENWSGNVVPPNAHMSDLFQLIRTEQGWRIVQKLFHQHAF